MYISLVVVMVIILNVPKNPNAEKNIAAANRVKNFSRNNILSATKGLALAR